MVIVERLYNLIGNGFFTTFVVSVIPLFELKGGILFARKVGMGFFESLAAAFLGSMIVFFMIFFLLQPLLKLLKRVKWFNAFATLVENYFQTTAEKSVTKNAKKSFNKSAGKSQADEHTVADSLQRDRENGCSCACADVDESASVKNTGDKATLIESTSLKRKLFIVYLFVALPLPLTGVWTGTALAVFLGLKFRYALPCIALGNLTAGVIISVLAELFYKYVDYIIYAFTGLVVLSLIILIVKLILTRKRGHL